MTFLTENIRINSLETSCQLPVDVLRLDLIHPVVSGNKWFKLKEYLQLAKQSEKTTLITYGGAYSNHIVATVAAANMHGLKSAGIIRGEEPASWSPTLSAAKEYGMQLFFTSRENYRQKTIPPEIFNSFDETESIVIPEGGYGQLGALGAKDILLQTVAAGYSHIVTAVGTGTTLAGLALAVLPHQQVIGIPVLKNAFSLEEEIKALLPPEKNASFQLINDYHFGGYAKRSATVISFMNDFYDKTGIPTDFIYTGKTFLGVFNLFEKGYFTSSDKVLLLHTGGLQGNLSLPKGTLIFG
jgi:1-aminocyclopropane-1-carboxylate deaminase